MEIFSKPNYLRTNNLFSLYLLESVLLESHGETKGIVFLPVQLWRGRRQRIRRVWTVLADLVLSSQRHGAQRHGDTQMGPWAPRLSSRVSASPRLRVSVRDPLSVLSDRLSERAIIMKGGGDESIQRSTRSGEPKLELSQSHVEPWRTADRNAAHEPLFRPT